MSHVNALLGVDGSWSPADLPALALWLDSTDGPTVSGATVTGWLDKSGHGRHFTSAGSPSLAVGPGGLPVVSLTPSDQMTTPAWGLSTTSVTVLGVARTTNTYGTRRVWASMGSNNHVALTHAGGYGGREGVLFGGVAWWEFDSPIYGTWVRQTLTIGGGLNTYRRGALSADSSYVPRPQTGFAYLNGDNFGTITCSIAELIVCEATLSATERDQCEAYLAQKWGTP